MDLDNGLLKDYFPLQTGGLPLPCDVLVGAYMAGSFSWGPVEMICTVTLPSPMGSFGVG